MARREVNIGVEGNDATGDSIRESFRKVNENFQEIYAIFGAGGSISFTALSDTPDTLLPNTIPLVNDAGSQLQLVELASNSALDETAEDTITFSYSAAGKLVISTAFTKLSDDQKPSLGGPLNVGGYAIANIDISQDAVEEFNSRHNTNLTIDDLVITKGYGDRRYISSGLPIRIAEEPVNQDSYILEISRYINGNIEVIGHGYDTGINGTAFIFSSIYDDPTGLTSGNTYYLRYVSVDQLSVFTNYEDAIQVDDVQAAIDKTFVSGVIGADDVHKMTDAGVDTTLEGNFLSDVAMPRESIVRRQGDTMTGELTLSDHPGDLSGFGIVNGADDLQAATKFYVDNSGYSSTENLFVSTSGDDRMIGVPPGREGSGWQYAYRTINAAARRAEEIIKTSRPEPGPYFQTVTKEEGSETANVTVSEVNAPVYTQAKDLILLNREYIQKEISGYLKYKYPDFIYDIETCERDTGLILDAIAWDINRGLAANFLTREAAEAYYSSTSGRYAITQQKTETLDAINTTKAMIEAILQNTLYREKTIDSIALSGTGNNRARVTTTTNHGLADGEQVIFYTRANADLGIAANAGMVEIDKQTAYVKVIDADTFELYTDNTLIDLWDISAYTAYTTGGKMGVVYQDRVEEFDSIKVFQGTDLPDAGSSERNAINAKFDLITNIIENGIDAGGDIVYGSTYKIVLDNGTRTFVDQANPDNVDTLPGKIMVGKVSGAKGRIVSVTQNDGTENNNDTFQLIQLNGKAFEVGEPVEYGNFVKQKQITILVESGIYEEDLPIRLSNNVSLKGDEFRRTIIRPKDRVSQSKWADLYFFRDKEFDDIPLATTGAPFYNQNGDLQGYFGRHYLSDNERILNTGVPVTNAGNFTTAAEILKLNKNFIQQEVLYYINNNYQDLLYDKTICQRDLGYLIDATTYDVALGTNYNAVTAGLAYQRAASDYTRQFEITNTLLAIGKVQVDIAALTAVGGNATALTRANAALDEIEQILQGTVADADALSFPAPANLPTADADDAALQLQANRAFIIAEITAWIADNYPLLDYNVATCERDVGYIVDALTYDVLYGGNSASIVAARSYYNGTISQLGVGESTATSAAYGRLQDIVKLIVREQTVTPTTGNLLTQDTSGTPAGASEATALDTLVQIIIDVIDDGDLTGLPVEVKPDYLALLTDAGIEAAAGAIISARSTLITDAISYLDANISFSYDQDKCARDVGLIIDALATDLIRGGNEFTLEAQGDYYYNYINQFDDGNFGGQATITKAAINHIDTLAQDLLVDINPTSHGDVIPDTSLGNGEAGTVAIVNGLIDRMTFAFSDEFNPPKRNNDDGVDVFLMSDATIVRNCTVQGHGGFMVVLDPEGQILTKSPYIQTGSSFSKSDNAKRFRGGMYVDAFVGNIPANIVGKTNNFQLDLESEIGQGLFVRPPELPCPFYVDGRRYQVNAISDYNQANGTVTIYLDSNSNQGTGYDETQFADGLVNRPIFLQTAGNRSMLGNDFTQINDLGYGLVTNNGALSEMVSMFTYYCQAAYYASNGSEIRSTNGSNGYGNFGLVAEGADPNEIPDQVTLLNPMVQPCKAYTNVTYPNALDDPNITVTDLQYPPTINSLITINHATAGRLNYRISSVYNLSDTDNDGVDGNSPGDVVATGGVYSNRVYRLELRADDVVADDFYGTLQETVTNGTLIEYRDSFTYAFEGVREPSRLVTRPSTAINFDESDEVTYRSLSFAATDSFSQPLAADEILCGFDAGFNYLVIETDNANLTGGYGSASGDTNIAVSPLSAVNQDRLTRDVAGLQPGDPGYAGGMEFVWNGKTHQVTNYTSGAFDYITISDVAGRDIGGSGAGLAAGIPTADPIQLEAGLQPGATAEITIAISLCRATGHDFTQIGTGGFNDSNYPNVILGDPENDLAESYTDAPTATSAQVWERRKGRVFWMSTDQYGFFRVGKYFSVDQATGDIEFAGEIGITNANSLGFKRGVTINEFSADDSMSDNSGQAVPTEKAIVGYLNRVLGWNVGAGSQILAAPSGNRLGTGFLPLNGGSAMEGDIDMGTNQITNVGNPGTDGTAAANKNYVDGKVNDFDQLEDLRNTELNNVAANDILVATGYKRIITTPVSGGTWTTSDEIRIPSTGTATKTGDIIDIEAATDPILGAINIITYSPTLGTFLTGETIYATAQSGSAVIEDGPVDEWANASETAGSVINFVVDRSAGGKATYDIQIEDNTIMNADVNASAAISQSKLNMQSADTFDESDAALGWTNPSKVQADLGLAKFSDENFETSSGYVRIKANGLVFAELQDVTQYQVYGRQTAGSGDPEAVAYSNVVKYGQGLEDRDFTDAAWVDADVLRLVTSGPITVQDGEVITQATTGATGTVQGDVYLDNVIFLINYTASTAWNTTSGYQLSGTVSGALGANSALTGKSTDTNVGSALIQIENNRYATTQISTGTGADTIARRDTSGKLDAAAIKVSGYDILTVSSTTLNVKTPGGATVFSSVGTADVSMEVPGKVNVNTTVSTESNAQSGATEGTVGDLSKGFVAAPWMYTNFIEAAQEAGEQSNQTTGISIGGSATNNSGYTNAGANTIIAITGGNPRLTVTDTSVTTNAILSVGTSLTVTNGASFGGGYGSTGVSISDTGNISADGNLIVNGNVTLGSDADDDIAVNGDFTTSLDPNTNGNINMGSAGTRWGTIYATVFNGVATQAKYADLAEKYTADADYEPGTVVVFGGAEEVSITNTKGDHRVAGVVSTAPAYLMNNELEGEHVVDVALTGRVPCKVLGKVNKGDILVSSAVPGYAIVDNNPKPGTIIGKALVAKSDDGKGMIEIVVGR